MELLCSSTKPTKNARLRFTMQNDLDILRQVLVENPFEDPSRWQSINNSINAITGKDFSVRATREHTEYLLKLFAKEDLSKLRNSSTLLVPYKSRKRNYNDQQVKSDILKYLRERGDKENRLKEQQIEIENKRIQLKEQRLLLEEQKYQIEKEERLSLIENMKNQQQLLANVIAQLTTNKN
ncbi:hypothetical protein ABEB36_015321 [Hypothenemus hampei]|uniref:Uncharacterized protein n=1 Tax=Hypothenemus hampei TaxID=57062 RepID=A0ABD1DZW0_HYPHA